MAATENSDFGFFFSWVFFFPLVSWNVAFAWKMAEIINHLSKLQPIKPTKSLIDWLLQLKFSVFD